jgi:hypothetical protein
MYEVGLGVSCARTHALPMSVSARVILPKCVHSKLFTLPEVLCVFMASPPTIRGLAGMDASKASQVRSFSASGDECPWIRADAVDGVIVFAGQLISRQTT